VTALRGRGRLRSKKLSSTGRIFSFCRLVKRKKAGDKKVARFLFFVLGLTKHLISVKIKGVFFILED
jgi:hypothetical protein